MFYKVENGMLIESPEKSLKVFIANPTDEQYRFFGYTDKLVEDERPEDEENFITEEWYEQDDNTIYKHYRKVQINLQEE